MQIALLKQGNERAFGFFYKKYAPQLHRRLLNLVRVDFVAEELLQELFVKVWDKKHLINPEYSFKSYLYRIAENLVYDYFRELVRETQLSQKLFRLSNHEDAGLEEQLQAKEIQHLIDAAVNTLPPQQRAVFTLCKIQGKSYDEAAIQLGISVATINTHITRATKAIKLFLDDKNGYQTLILLAVNLLFMNDGGAGL